MDEKRTDPSASPPPRKPPHRVKGPKGSITAADLPLPNIKRWVAGKKAIVVCAVRGGLLTLDEAYARYNLSIEEFNSWTRDYDRGWSSEL
jgi:hypothetical protein